MAVRHSCPSSLRSCNAMLRTRAAPSAPCGSPPPIDMRPNTGVLGWLKMRADDSQVALPLDWNCPLTHTPLVCARRKPGCGGPLDSMVSVMRAAVSRSPPIQPAVQANAMAMPPAIAAIPSKGTTGLRARCGEGGGNDMAGSG